MTTRERIESLLRQGLTKAEIARRLGVAGPTVEYHVARIRAGAERGRPPAAARSSIGAHKRVATRERVAALLEAGQTRADIARRLGLSKGTVSYHARRLGSPVDARCARRYDWQAIQDYYDRGHSIRECMAEFGFTSQTWHAAVARGAVVSRPARTPSERFFAAGVYRNRTYLKARLLDEGMKEERCEECGIRDWRGGRLSLELHHVNGDRLDNRVGNLQLLCPNCHSQTESFSGRNGHRRPVPARRL